MRLRGGRRRDAGVHHQWGVPMSRMDTSWLGRSGLYRRLVALVGGLGVIVLGVLGIYRGDQLFGGITTAIGSVEFVTAVLYHRRAPSPTHNPPVSKTFFWMSLGWLGIGVITLLVGIAAGGGLLIVCMVGFTASMYLFVGMMIAAVRGPWKRAPKV